MLTLKPFIEDHSRSMVLPPLRSGSHLSVHFTRHMYSQVPKTYELPISIVHVFLHSIEKNWSFPLCKICTQFSHNPTKAYQISDYRNQNSIFGEFFKSIFMILQNILLQAICGEFFKFDCIDI